MKRLMLASLAALSLLSAGCLLPGWHGPVLLVPPLPPIVELDVEPYYVQGEYHYYYQNDNWSYSRSRNGPWMQLPRDRYPKEVRFKGRGHDQGRGEKRGHD